jgi:hypothetical protein
MKLNFLTAGLLIAALVASAQAAIPASQQDPRSGFADRANQRWATLSKAEKGGVAVGATVLTLAAVGGTALAAKVRQDQSEEGRK